MILLKHTLIWLLLISICQAQEIPKVESPHEAGRYNVVWSSPSKDASGTMPLGNGDIGANAWVAPNGDLIFYISKTDSWGDNGRLLKVGKVRVTFNPPLFSPGTQFSQKLDLDIARLIEIKAIHEKFPQDAFRYLEMTKPDFEGFPESKEINSLLAEWKK